MFFVFFWAFKHLFFRFFVIYQFTLVRDLLNVLRKFDLFIISFLTPFVMREFLLYLVCFAYREQMYLLSTEISQEIISQVVKSCFEVFCWKSFDNTFYSNDRKQFFGLPLRKVFLKTECCSVLLYTHPIL